MNKIVARSEPVSRQAGHIKLKSYSIRSFLANLTALSLSALRGQIERIGFRLNALRDQVRKKRIRFF